MRDYQRCIRCVMDTTAEDIFFDRNGVCNYCKEFETQLADNRETFLEQQTHRENFLEKVKADGKGKDYDCIVGVSGGVDSSYALYLAVKNGLRPLAVHLDNGWNSELATHNISSLVEKLDVDLYTHVIDWEENRDLQLSFFRANVLDIELLMDNAMLAINYEQARRFNLHFLLFGFNVMTEGMKIPSNWNHYKKDVHNIKNIHKIFGKIPIKTHPLISTNDLLKYRFLYGIKSIAFLDYFNYNKNDAINILKSEFGYKPYPYKHYESVFTRFYQGYILPKKFGVDKRLVHLSTLIMSGQITREEAINMLNTSPYPDPKQEEQDRQFIIKKLGFTESDFNDYMNTPEVPHQVYGSEKWKWNTMVSVNRILKRLGIKIPNL